MGKLIIVNVNNDKRWSTSKENCVYIGRPSLLSNPYSSKKSNIDGIIQVSSKIESLTLYKKHFQTNLNKFKPEFDKIEFLLEKFDEVYLGCFCVPDNCHGNIIKNYLLLKKYNS